MLGGWKAYGWRVSRGSAIASVNRGGDYVVHGALLTSDGRFRTACGLLLYLPNEHDSPTAYVTCKRCLKALPK